MVYKSFASPASWTYTRGGGNIAYYEASNGARCTTVPYTETSKGNMPIVFAACPKYGTRIGEPYSSGAFGSTLNRFSGARTNGSVAPYPGDYRACAYVKGGPAGGSTQTAFQVEIKNYSSVFLGSAGTQSFGILNVGQSGYVTLCSGYITLAAGNAIQGATGVLTSPTTGVSGYISSITIEKK